jgi:hypothetical protein
MKFFIVLFLFRKGSRVDQPGSAFDGLQLNGHVFTTTEKIQILVGGNIMEFWNILFNNCFSFSSTLTLSLNIVAIFVLLSSGSLFLLIWGSAAPIAGQHEFCFGFF